MELEERGHQRVVVVPPRRASALLGRASQDLSYQQQGTDTPLSGRSQIREVAKFESKSSYDPAVTRGFFAASACG